jgi:hypothetical protein
MDWGRLVTDDANETDLLRSYVVRVTDATFGYMAEQAAAESGVPAADGRERMWTLLERGALRGSSDPSRMTTALAWSLVTATSGMSRRRRTSRWSNGDVRWQPAQRSLNRADGMLRSCSRLTGPEAKKTPAAGRETTARSRRLGFQCAARARPSGAASALDQRPGLMI